MSVGLLACTVNTAQAETFSCTADKNTVGHFMEVTLQDGKISKFDYSSSTPVSGSVNNCSVDSNGAKVSEPTAGVQAFALPGSDMVPVSKKGKQFVFDFSKVDITAFCGQSSPWRSIRPSRLAQNDARTSTISERQKTERSCLLQWEFSSARQLNYGS